MAEGINNQPESWDDWLNRIIPIVNQRADWRGQGTFYATTALTVEANEPERVQTFADILKAYPGVEAHAIGHSNGTRVVLDGWKACDPIASRRPKLTTVHLLCGACDADCDANGINAGILGGTLGDVFIYVAKDDMAMRVEDTIVGKTLFDLPEGHVPLGLAGPRNLNPLAASQVHVIEWPDFGHSTCWDEGHFNDTVTQIITLAEMYSASSAKRAASFGGSATGQQAAPQPATKPLLTPRQEGLAQP